MIKSLKKRQNKVETARTTWKDRLKLAIKILLPAGLYIGVLRVIDLKELYLYALEIRIGYFILGLLAAWAMMPFPAFFQCRMLELKDIRVKVWRMLQLDFIAKFYSFLMPGEIAGSVVKWSRLYLENKRGTQLASVLLVYKFISLLAVMVVGFMGFWGNLSFWESHIPHLNLLILTVICLIAVGIWGLAKLEKKDFYNGRRFFKQRTALKIEGKVREFLDAVIDFRDDWPVLLKIFIWKTIFLMAVLYYLYLFALSANINITFYQLAVCAVVARMILSIPITYFGIGVQEWTFLFMLKQYGVVSEKIILFSLLHTLSLMLTSLLGGLFEIHEQYFE